MKTLAAGLEILNGEQYSSLKRFWRIVQVQIGKDSVHYCRPKMAQVVLQNEVWQEASAVTGAGLRFPLLELSLSGRRSLTTFASMLIVLSLNLSSLFWLNRFFLRKL